jgi:hypothetical protein
MQDYREPAVAAPSTRVFRNRKHSWKHHLISLNMRVSDTLAVSSKARLTRLCAWLVIRHGYPTVPATHASTPHLTHSMVNEQVVSNCPFCHATMKEVFIRLENR